MSINRLMAKQNVLFSQKEEQNYVICRKIDGNGDHHVKQDKPDTQALHIFFHMCNLDFKSYMKVEEGILGGDQWERVGTQKRMMGG
jgi:hypothetical protein